MKVSEGNVSLDEKQREFVEKVYSEFYKPLLIYARNVCSDYDEAEDLVQETFRVGCKKIDEFMSSPNPKGWITNTLKHLNENNKRLKFRSTMLMAEYDILNDEQLKHEDEYISLMYSDLISQDDREILEMFSVKGFTISEIAEKLNIPISVCNKRIQRARKKLQKALDDANKIK